MDKLVKKFDNIIKFSSMTYLSAEKCAELTKQIAIEFAKYIHTVSYIKVTEDESWDVYTTEELFTKFLEDYGK